MSVKDSTVLVTGATGAAGKAACLALVTAGATVIGVGRDRVHLEHLSTAVPGITTLAADVSDPAAVQSLVARVHRDHPRVDGLVHLVGGWRGGSTFADNTDADWHFLSHHLIDTTRHLTLALHDDLAASPAGRAVIISAAAASNPTAGNAGYAAAKAATEAWMRALADSFHATQAASVILVVNALVNPAMRAAEPERPFDTFTDVSDVAARIVALWEDNPALINGARISMVPTPG